MKSAQADIGNGGAGGLSRRRQLRQVSAARMRSRLVVEFLAVEHCLEHQTTLGDGEHGYAVVGVAAALRRGLVAHVRAGRAAGRAGVRACTRRDRHSRCLAAELEVAARESIEGSLVLEEDDL